MGETNQTNNRRAMNAKAFNDTIEQYEIMKYKSAVTAIDNSKDNPGTLNPAKPSPTDFACDIDMIVMKVLQSKELFNQFIDTYILGNDSFSKSWKFRIEQKVGQLFRQRGIWPVSKYFLTVRQRIRP